MRLCLVEDNAVAGLEPLTLTRPVFDLLLGCDTLGAKIARAFGVGPGPAPSGRGDPALSGGRPARARPAHGGQRPRLAGPRAGGRGQRPLGPAGRTSSLPSRRRALGRPLRRPARLLPWSAPRRPSGSSPTASTAGSTEWPREADCVELGGEWIDRPWDLVARNADHLARDFRAEGKVGRRATATSRPPPWSGRPTGCSSTRRPGSTRTPSSTPPTARSPSAAGAWVQPFTRIEGPCYIGRDTQLFRANLRGGVTIGPNCRIGGEVEAAIVHGHSNKYHEGFLGHAYVGEWVNLGAITSNSDLRNDYGEVYVPLGGDPVATGQAKVGCFIGDHTRTGLGSMLNTGTADRRDVQRPARRPAAAQARPVVRRGALRPGGPRVPARADVRHRPDRHGPPRARTFTEVEEQLYLDLYEQTRLERERAFQKANDRRGDHWPVAAFRLRAPGARDVASRSPNGI